jgi:hypothetical protein
MKVVNGFAIGAVVLGGEDGRMMFKNLRWGAEPRFLLSIGVCKCRVEIWLDSNDNVVG